MNWMSDFVPERIRGRFFARRNLICSGVGLAITLLAGFYLDLFQNAPERIPVAFGALFTAFIAVRFVGIYYMGRMPDAAQRESGSLVKILRDLGAVVRDSNFMRYVVFVSVFNLFICLAAPFYTVYLLEELKVSMGTVTLLQAIGGIGAMISFGAWGKLSDRYGHKPVFIASGLTWLIPCLAWQLTTPGRWHFLYPLYFLNGLMCAGLILASFNLLLKLVPAETKTAYISTYVSITGLAAAVGPILGGQLLELWKPWHLDLFGQRFTAYHLLFLLQVVPASLSFLLLARLKEPAERRVSEVIGAMRNMREFNPVLGFWFVLQRVFTPRGLKG